MKRPALLISLLVAAWLGVVLHKAEIEARFSSWALLRANRASRHANNPLYDEMRDTAAQYGLDVSFIKQATRNREIDLSSVEIFSRRPGYYDVVVFGDSSLIWSFSPQLVAQASGKRVAFLGYESALPNKGFVPFAEQICDVYLKKGGTAVFLFDFWHVDPSEPQRTGDMQKMTRPSEASVARQELERAADAILGLPHLAVYGDAVEPFFAPERYKKEHFGAQGMGCAFYSWGARSDAVFLHCRRDNGEASPAGAHTVNIANTIVKSCSGVGNANTLLNLTALAHSKISNVVIAIPFSDGARADLFCEAQKLQDQLRILDLPRLAVEKYNVNQLEIQGATHLANTASIPASAVLGRALADLPPK